MWGKKFDKDIEQEPLEGLAFRESNTLETLQAFKEKDNSKSNE
jgi:hypothetical protein